MHLRNLKQADLVERSNLSKQQVSQYVNGKFEAKQQAVYALAQVLDVNEAWLMGDDVPMEKIQMAATVPTALEEKYHSNRKPAKKGNNIEIFTSKDEKDIAKKLLSTLDQLNNQQEALMFDGEPLDDESRELLRISLENSLKMGKVIAKQKFTPKKYQGRKN